MFVSHYMNRLVGTVSPGQSQFRKVVATWERFLMHDLVTMAESDTEAAADILAIMASYQEMKESRAKGDDYSAKFWPRMAVIADLSKGENPFDEVNAKKATGSQLAFWTKTESLLNNFRTAKWVNKKGEEAISSGVLSQKPKTKQYWRNSWGEEPVVDTHGNQLTDLHIIATEILNNESLLADAFGNSRILSASL